MVGKGRGASQDAKRKAEASGEWREKFCKLVDAVADRDGIFLAAGLAKKRKLASNDKSLRGVLSSEVDLTVLLSILHKEATSGQDDASLPGTTGGGKKRSGGKG